MRARISVKVNDASRAWWSSQEVKNQRALIAMANATHAGARITVPKKTNALDKSGRVEGRGNERRVIFGGRGIAYGAVQERGYREGKNGRVYFRHYTTAGTGPHYLQNAGKAAVGKGLLAYR